MEQKRVGRRKARRERLITKGRRMLYEYSLLFLGSLIIAVSFNVFYAPNQVAAGGVSGISIIVEHLLGIQPAFTQWGLNIPIFIAGIWLLGKQYGVKTFIGSILLPLLILLTTGLPALKDNLLLASIYGGILLGVGVGLVFRGRASTGGTDLVAQMIHKFTGLSLGACLALIDGLVIISAGVVFSLEKALYALIGLYVTSKTINIVQVGFGYSKSAFIISSKNEDIKEAILKELDRGVTKLQAVGGFTGSERVILMTVVSQTEVSKLKDLVKRKDPDAFVILSDTNEVLGQGFKVIKND